MEESNCDIILTAYPPISELDDFQSTFIVNCVLNSFICYSAIMLNILTICAIAKTSAMPKPLKTLLLSVAVSDLGVGLIVEPFYLSLFIIWFQLRDPGCFFHLGLGVFLNLFSMASFWNILAISVERFFAIQLPFRYQALVTHKRVVGVVIFIWTFISFASFSMFFFPLVVLAKMVSGVGTICLMVATAIYCKIYHTTRRHKRQIQVHQIQQQQALSRQNNEMRNLVMTMKTAVSVLNVYFVFLACYVPRFIFLTIRAMNDRNISMINFRMFTYTLMFFNSSLNPVIYCWRMRHIRRTMVDTLRKLYTNRVS